MKQKALERMPLDDLWQLHLQITDKLAVKLAAEKRIFEERLVRLTMGSTLKADRRELDRRPYPTVHPKFQNPTEPFQTWTGRGKRPRWLLEQLESGRLIEDFRIQHAA